MRKSALFKTLLACLFLPAISFSQSNAGKPNFLVIWGDDIGTWNISHNNRGMMGYRTPNIDRIAKRGLPSRIIMDNNRVQRDALHFLEAMYLYEQE